jgi:hypothetical protein
VQLHIYVALFDQRERLLVAKGFQGQFSILAVESRKGDSIPTQLLNQLQQHGNCMCCLSSLNAEI